MHESPIPFLYGDLFYAGGGNAARLVPKLMDRGQKMPDTAAVNRQEEPRKRLPPQYQPAITLKNWKVKPES